MKIVYIKKTGHSMSSSELIIITGASSGIGMALAKLFSAAGYSLGLLARNIAAMEALQLPNTSCIQTDVTNIDSFKKAIMQAEARFGPIACLINNAGFAKGGEFTTIAHQDQQIMVQVNIMGVINGIDAVLPQMRERQFGTIINISSLADRNSRPNTAVYAATKAAVKSLTESLRADSAKYGIRLCNIAPAKIRTPMLMGLNMMDQQLIEVEDFAKTVLWVYQQPKNICIRDMIIAPTYYEA